MTWMNSRIFLFAVFVCTLTHSLCAVEIRFNQDIRPILAENCFYCHGQDANKRQADLRLDDREAAIVYGAIEPGDADASELIARIMSDDPDTLMPPPDSNRQLSASEKDLLKQWIDQGAPFETHWAFVAPVRPTPPEVDDQEWPKGAIDRFVLAKLNAEGLSPSPQADRATLIRRLHADLTGLPPTLEEVDAFVSDPDPLAYERLVDRLLNSPHFGERFALPWLDAARYADSNGFQQDGDTWQWTWRDWVVRALNDDMPFDQFTIWQLAGDLLPNPTHDQLIATGFNRNHLLNGEGGAIAEEQRFNTLFDRVETTTTTWLGLTVACAQCHDHKYDPIKQLDYYRMLDAFNHVPESGVPDRFSARIRLGHPVLELPTEENRQRIAELESQIAHAEATQQPLWEIAFAAWKVGGSGGFQPPPAASADESSAQQVDAAAAALRKHFDEKVRGELKPQIPGAVELDSLRSQLAEYKADQIPRVMVMSDAKDRTTHVLDRGAYLSPLEPVTFDTPEFLPPMPDGAPANRLGLAQWLVSPEHPLTARVQANRIWQYFFGNGIVKTTEDFGIQSEYPVHRELLDWLAVEFRENGWSVKGLIRSIVTSATYRQSSRVTPELLERDAENRLFARASKFRMPSMVLRDWALASSGLLVDEIQGPPVYPYQPDQVWEALSITKERDFTYPTSSGDDLYRRSLYTFWRRTVSPANMFDASDRQTCRVRSATNNTPLHALTTLNDPTWIEASRMLAEQVMSQHTQLDRQLITAFRRVLARTPADAELQRLTQMHANQLNAYRDDEAAAKQLLSVGEKPRDVSFNAVEHAAMTATCLGIYNLDEALSRE